MPADLSVLSRDVNEARLLEARDVRPRMRPK